jgi:hypothetical protein
LQEGEELEVEVETEAVEVSEVVVPREITKTEQK